MDYIENMIIRYRLKVTPVLDRRGQIEFWSAGKVTLASNRYTNIVTRSHHAEGYTLREAVENALKRLVQE